MAPEITPETPKTLPPITPAKVPPLQGWRTNAICFWMTAEDSEFVVSTLLDK